MQEITFQDKDFVNEQTSIPDVNKVKADDMNEIKSVVNNNANELNSVKEQLNETNYIRGILTNNQTISNNYVDVLYNTATQLGTGLTLSNGKITVNSDTIKVLIISSSLKTSDWNNTTIYMQTLKNGVLQSQTIQNTANIKLFVIIPVTKNDVISIQCYCATQKTFNAVDTAYNYIEILGI